MHDSRWPGPQSCTCTCVKRQCLTVNGLVHAGHAGHVVGGRRVRHVRRGWRLRHVRCTAGQCTAVGAPRLCTAPRGLPGRRRRPLSVGLSPCKLLRSRITRLHGRQAEECMLGREGHALQSRVENSSVMQPAARQSCAKRQSQSRPRFSAWHSWGVALRFMRVLQICETEDVQGMLASEMLMLVLCPAFRVRHPRHAAFVISRQMQGFAQLLQTCP